MAEEDKHSHTIFTTLSNILELEKDKLSMISDKTITDEQASIFKYTLASVRNIKTRLYEVPDIFLNVKNLDQINSHLTPLHSELSNYVNNKNAGHLNSARTHIDTALKVAAWALPLTNNSAVSKKIENEISNISAASESAIAKLESEKEKLINQISEQSQKLHDQDQKITNLTQTFDAKAAEANTASAEVKTAYAKLEQNIDRQFNEKIEFFDNEFVKLKSNKENSANDMLVKIENYRENAKKILGIIGNIGITGNYSQRFIDEKSQADTWRILTISLFGLGIFIAVVSLLSNFSGQFTFRELIIRIAIAITIVLPTFYTSRESARHRTNADRAKQTELELASLGPFIESLPSDKKEELRTKLTDNYFGNQIDAHDIKSPIDSKDMNQTLQAITEFIKEAKK